MFERYTQRARVVHFLSRHEAWERGSTVVETEDLLLGLMREGNAVVIQRILKRSNTSAAHVYVVIKSRVAHNKDRPATDEIRFSPEAERVLEYATTEADNLKHKYIGTEHLLLGVVRDETSLAAAILAEHGIHLEDVRQFIVQQLIEAQTGGE